MCKLLHPKFLTSFLQHFGVKSQAKVSINVFVLDKISLVVPLSGKSLCLASVFSKLICP